MMHKERSGRRLRVALVTCTVTVALALLSPGAIVFGGTYQPCQLPVVVGATVRPNVMLIQDMSGSMQFTSYYAADFETYYATSKTSYSSFGISPLSGLTAYQMATGYYSSADTDTYYRYNATGNSTGGYFEPVDSSAALPTHVQFTAVSQDGGGGTSIKFTAAGHGLVVGDWAAFYSLSSHSGMNGDAYQVTAVSGDTFTVTAEWNKVADTTAGQVVKRVISGTAFNTGINGTVLNFLLSCRTDAVMKAFIGGRSTTTDTIPDPNDSTKTITRHYLKYMGMRRFVVDETLGCLAYVRQGTVNNPEAYDKGTFYGTIGSLDATNGEKDLYLTVSNFYKGTLNNNDPYALKNRTGSRAQVWSFTLTTAATVKIRMFPATNTSGNPAWTTLLNLYSGATPTNAGYTAAGSTYDYGTTNVSDTNDGCATITKTLAAGTYCIEATSYDNNRATYYLSATFEEDANHSRGSDPNILLTRDATDPGHNGVLWTSTVGSILSAQCRIQQPDANRSGVVQSSFNLVRFGFMFYNSSIPGKILVGCDNTDMNLLINAISGIGSQTVNGVTQDFTQCYPYNGTPTGEAMGAAYNYFAQLNSYTGVASNTAFYPRRTTITDPYYGPDLDASNKPMAVPCRKSYLLLTSDGEWNGSIDPIKPAREMHVGDLRTDLINPTIVTSAGTKVTYQNVYVYTIFSFNTAVAGANSMKATAMYGAFLEVSGCGSTTNYPYPFSTYPTSTGITWPITVCDPRDPPPSGNSYNVGCCAEWDSLHERTGEVTDSQKGIPDTYFEASDGKQLEDSLKKVLQQVLAGDASASAVATVSQQLSTGDTIIRGVFEASDPEQVEKFLWYGHLEAFWTFKDPEDLSKDVYDFDKSCNVGLRCEEMPGPGCAEQGRHCWDGGKILRARDLTTKHRWIFTAAYDGGDEVWKPIDFVKDNPDGAITAAMLGVGSTTAATNLINWTLGEKVTGLRDRSATATENPQRLGDIVYSTPVVGGPPSPGAVSPNDPNIGEFYRYRNETLTPGGCPDGTCTQSTSPLKREILYRDKVVFVGANDGMVHAFLLAKWNGSGAKKKWQDQSPAKDPDDVRDATRVHGDIGKELWAYIPSNMLKKLQVVADTTYGSTSSGGCAHRAMVDLSDQVYEVYIHRPPSPVRAATPARPARAKIEAGTTREWRSVLIGGERGGGDTYFAIDVTEPWDPIVMWEYSVVKDRVVLYNAKAYQPFGNAYDSMCDFPMSWTQPALGRLQLPEVDFYTGSPSSTGLVIGAATKEKFIGDLANRHVVFVGGGLRLFDKTFTTTPTIPAPYDSTEWAAFKADLFKPSLVVLDMETGHNLFKYIWPKLVETGGTTVWPVVTRGSNTVPYAMNDPVAIDIWNPITVQPSDDGFTDRLYLSDINGLFYAVKFTSAFAAATGIQVDVWRTKPITNATEQASNIFRDVRQPITQSPSISFETPQVGVAPNLRVIFAAGKYEDIVGATDDKTDLNKTSLYNLQDTAAEPTLSGSATDVYSTGFRVAIAQHCTSTSFLTGCTWTKSTGLADCCQSSCASPCYKCVFDLTQPTESAPGERFVAKPLIAGGLVFATSFLPSLSPCDFTGTGYLYIFDYQCERFEAGFNPLTDATDPTTYTVYGGSVTSGTAYGIQLPLGVGMPSKPVLDSTGSNVIVQMSDGTLKRIPVKLKLKPTQVQGWQEK